MSRPRGAYIGGETVIYLPEADAPLEAACHDAEFIEFCIDLACYIVPPKEILAHLFVVQRFKAPMSGWTADSAAKVFEQAIGLVLREMIGSGRRTREVLRNGWRGTAPKILGMSAYREPYAWSPGSWR
jgi:hypothetical protein